MHFSNQLTFQWHIFIYMCLRMKMLVTGASSYKYISFIFICGALHDLVPFLQFTKLEKHPWRRSFFWSVFSRIRTEYGQIENKCEVRDNK